MSCVQPVVILVAPQMGENIGMAARAMLNCGLTRLRLVRPRDGWPSDKAIKASAGADEVINNVAVYDSTAQAIADLNFVFATTARQRQQAIPSVNPRMAAQDLQQKSAQKIACGILFGGERAGLDNDDVALAHHIISIPLNPAFKSLNLAHAVLVIAYEWFALQNVPMTTTASETQKVVLGDFENFMSRLETALSANGYFKTEDLRPIMRRNLRNIFKRSLQSDQDIRTLHGVVRALQNRHDDEAH